MDIRQALTGVASYSHLAGRDQAAQQHLAEVRRNPPPEFPLGLKVLVSGSGQSLPRVPWIALLDKDVTETAQDGLYLCYLFTEELDGVYLSMNQGATQHLRVATDAGHKGRAAERAAIEEIREETRLLRSLVTDLLPPDSDAQIDLRSQAFLPLGYEAGNIAGVRYSLSALPPAPTLADELSHFLALYSACIEVKDQLAANRQLKTSARSARRRVENHPLKPEFKPKNSSEYIANVKASTQRRTRKHESLLDAFADDLNAAGHVPANNVHPRDLTIEANGDHWLVEAKTVAVNAEEAVRAAIGQLFSYRHFYYRSTKRDDPRLLALFDSPIGTAFEELLASLDIEVLCRTQGTWQGSEAAEQMVRTDQASNNFSAT